jgi:hypothetical protein
VSHFEAHDSQIPRCFFVRLNDCAVGDVGVFGHDYYSVSDAVILFVLLLEVVRNLSFLPAVWKQTSTKKFIPLEMLMEENLRAGMPLEEARRAARIELGGIEQVKAQVREERLGNWLHSVISSPLRTNRISRTNTGWFQVLPSSAGNSATSVN